MVGRKNLRPNLCGFFFLSVSSGVGVLDEIHSVISLFLLIISS